MKDTIAAISTPMSGAGGIGIVRMSGTDAIKIAGEIFASADKKKAGEYKPFTVHYGRIRDRNGKTVDEVLLAVMRAPKTYTRQDIAEISCHGGLKILEQILKLCLEHGARLAMPGEFTKRAFLNGRIDLVQAEAVCGLINSKTEQSARIFACQVEGRLSREINSVVSGLVDVIAGWETEINHPEEEPGTGSGGKYEGKLKKLLASVTGLCGTAAKGRIYAEGVRIAITGKPNAGKSSLLNRLLSADRSIVTDIAGTTRDIVSDTFNLKGIPVQVMDTAGIRSHYGSSDRIGKLAEKKTRSAIENAEAVIFMCDAGSKVSADDIKTASLLKKLKKKYILVLNKTDLARDFKNVLQKYGRFAPEAGQEFVCGVSALKNRGMDAFEEKIRRLITGSSSGLPSVACSAKVGSPDVADDAVVTSLRHETLLKECSANIMKAVCSFERKESLEFCVFHLRHALDNLGEITGSVTSEDILDRIFSRFCIGK